MKFSVPKNWKPLAVGLISTALGVIQVSKYGTDWYSAIRDHNIQMAIAIALLGFVTKQSNVTGGTSGQPSTPEALNAANQHPSLVNPPKEESK